MSFRHLTNSKEMGRECRARLKGVNCFHKICNSQLLGVNYVIISFKKVHEHHHRSPVSPKVIITY